MPAQRNLARWLLAQELGEGPTAEGLAEAAERVCQKLRLILARVVTVAGYQLLLKRALHLAQGEFAFLEGVQAGASGVCLDGLPARLDGIDSQTMHGALTVVLARMIELLVTFIGEDLAMRLVRGGWPDAPYDETSPPQAVEAQS